VVGSCVHGNGNSGIIIGRRFFGHMSDYQLLKKNTVQQVSWLVG